MPSAKILGDTDISVHVGESYLSLQFTLIDENDEPINITTWTIKLHAAAEGASSLKITGTCSPDDPTNGVCSYQLTTDDTDTAGLLYAHVKYDTGTYVAFTDLFTILVREDLPAES